MPLPLQVPQKSGRFVTATLNSLEASGVLTRDPRKGSIATCAPAERAECSALEVSLDYRPRIRIGHIFVFFRCLLAAKLLLTLKPLRAIVHHVRRHGETMAVGRSIGDSAGANELANVFKHLRPLLFAGRKRCQLDTLGLILFLAHYHIRSQWVFGVQTGPWSAHCWAQIGPTVLNDSVEHVLRYTPILLV